MFNPAQISNLQTKYWNKAYNEHYVPVIDAGGTKRAAEKARVAYLASIGCTMVKLGRSNIVTWNEQKMFASIPKHVAGVQAWEIIEA